jgi:hypothetical protein
MESQSLHACNAYGRLPPDGWRWLQALRLTQWWDFAYKLQVCLLFLICHQLLSASEDVLKVEERALHLIAQWSVSSCDSTLNSISYDFPFRIFALF